VPIGSLDRENNPVVIPLSSEADIQNVCPMKPYPAHSKSQYQPTSSLLQLETHCISPLRVFIASMALYITPTTSTWMMHALLAYA